jgi:ubiquinone/menaquinone biosynthesis C-methylase UbiE
MDYSAQTSCVLAEHAACAVQEREVAAESVATDPKIPGYLTKVYWWAYVYPNAVRLFERPWLINLILFGNYAKLSEAALSEFPEPLSGRTLQVACVYGELTPELFSRVARGGGSLDVVDALPVQLANLAKKLPDRPEVTLIRANSANLEAASATYDRALVFFLLHEQPADVREKTLREIMRVVKPGGKIVIVDYDRPRLWNPVRLIVWPVLALLEPFALDLWRNSLTKWLPASVRGKLRKTSYFGGVYQKIVIER